MDEYTERTYRNKVNAGNLVTFHVTVKETDLLVSARSMLAEKTRDLVLTYRHQLETYIRFHGDFLTTLKPYPVDPYAPALVKEMIRASTQTGVGPMATVAGALAEFVGKELLRCSDQVIVENGGDIFLQMNRPATVSLFAGSSPLSEKIGLKVPTRQMPLGICSSSGTIGHSMSFGIADLVCVLSPSAALADGAATSLGNRLTGKKELEKAAAWAGEIGGILGGVAIMGDRITAWGDVHLLSL